jgi:excisionase family DNA binding protein
MSREAIMPATGGFKTAEETGKILKLGTSTVYRLIAKGMIRGIKIGGSVRIPDAEFDRLQRGDPAP